MSDKQRISIRTSVWHLRTTQNNESFNIIKMWWNTPVFLKHNVLSVFKNIYSIGYPSYSWPVLAHWWPLTTQRTRSLFLSLPCFFHVNSLLIFFVPTSLSWSLSHSLCRVCGILSLHFQCHMLSLRYLHFSLIPRLSATIVVFQGNTSRKRSGHNVYLFHWNESLPRFVTNDNLFFL